MNYIFPFADENERTKRDTKFVDSFFATILMTRAEIPAGCIELSLEIRIIYYFFTTPSK